jgi:hypothetical protein
MTKEDIRTRLMAVPRMDLGGRSQILAQDIMKEVRAPLRALQRLLAWSVGNPDRGKAQMVVRKLGGLGILPWLITSRSLRGGEQVQALYEVYRAYQALDRSISQRLEPMLTHREPLPQEPLPEPLEAKLPITRECDDAYILLWRLHLPKSEGEEFQREYTFVRLTEPERDTLIRHYLEQREFRQ